MSGPNQPGFVLPPVGNQQPAYPAYPQPAYPPQPAHHQQAHHQHQPTAYVHQPFPAPIAGQQVAPSWNPDAGFQALLRNASLFHIKQKTELLEAIVGYETANQYSVKDQEGKKILYVQEETNCLARVILDRCRPFTLLVKDLSGREVLKVERNIDIACCCALLCGDVVSISTIQGQFLGSIKEDFHILQPSFSVRDATGATRLIIEGPVCPMAFCGQNLVFKIKTLDGVSIGSISKEYGGIIREFLTDADSFNITFPADMDLSMKSVLLGAVFMIDFHYFESGRGGKQGGRRLFG